jgi:hypothetical protein
LPNARHSMPLFTIPPLALLLSAGMASARSRHLKEYTYNMPRSGSMHGVRG